jgi:hypothetical protein
MEIETSGGSHVGERGEFVKEQDQACSLAEVRCGCASVEEPSGLGEELIREGRAIEWQRTRHEMTPRATGRMVFSDDTPIIGRLQRSVTLPLIVRWTTKTHVPFYVFLLLPRTNDFAAQAHFSLHDPIKMGHRG